MKHRKLHLDSHIHVFQPTDILSKSWKFQDIGVEATYIRHSLSFHCEKLLVRARRMAEHQADKVAAMNTSLF